MKFLFHIFSNAQKISGAWWSILLGFASFLLVTGGGKILRPTYIDWFLIEGGDSLLPWVGWQFFRHSPFLQWPLGANPDYGMGIGSSIVYSGSIPLLAFMFKPLNAFLPDTFQFIGLWILIGFLLQSLFAWKLLSLFTQDKRLLLIGSMFFIIAPIFQIGLASPAKFGTSYNAAIGQWVLLAGLYFYSARNFSAFRWIGLLVATTLIHAYLLAMLIVIWSADLIQRCWLKQTSIVKMVSHFFSSVASVATVMWAAGYFMLGSDVGNDGFGFYHMNLLSLIDPDAVWSKILRDQNGGFGDYEGFNYLGLGMLGLGLIASYEALCNGKINYEVKITPILIASVGLFLYAISNHVAIGAHEIFSYDLPSITAPITKAFRAPGRFFWPVYYIIYLAIFYLIFTRLKSSVAISLCGFMLLIQIIDSSAVWRMYKNKFARSPAWEPSLTSPAWRDITHQYRKIIYVLPENFSSNWQPLSVFAAMHRMAINTGSFARTNQERVKAERLWLTNEIINKKIRPDSLYIFDNDALWEIALRQIAPSDAAGVLDGFRVVAPNLRACESCNAGAIPSSFPGNGFEYQERISFTSDGVGQKYQAYGWSKHEAWGTWSDGDMSLVILPLPGRLKNDLELLIEGQAFLADKQPSQEIDVLANEHPIATLKYDLQHNGGVRAVKIPRIFALENNGYILIKFKFKNPKSPLELGVSADFRRLGLGIASLELKLAD